MGWKFWRKGSTGVTEKRGFRKSNIANIVSRFVQIIFACVVIGYYGQDLTAANKQHKYSDSKWVYGVVVGSISAIYALISIILGFITQYRTVAILFLFEWVIVILWAALLGIFGKMYFGENVEMDSGIQRMKNAAAFDAVNLIIWFIMASVATFVFFRAPKMSLHTGRAQLGMEMRVKS